VKCCQIDQEGDERMTKRLLGKEMEEREMRETGSGSYANCIDAVECFDSVVIV
jgi:hypothetical protein